LFQDGDVWVDVFPEGDEILAGGPGADARGIGIGIRSLPCP
jgi:hypothetical protein